MTNFTYLDQFPQVEINLNPLLDDIKQTSGFDYTFSNIQPIKTNLANIFEKINIIGNFKQDIMNFDPYVIQDGDDIMSVSYNKYGDMTYWWTIAIFNDIKNIFTDWPFLESQLIELAERLYITENKFSKTAYHQMLFERNEIKRRIVLPKTTIVNKIVATFRAVYEESLN